MAWRCPSEGTSGHPDVAFQKHEVVTAARCGEGGHDGAGWSRRHVCILQRPAYILTPGAPRPHDGPTPRFLSGFRQLRFPFLPCPQHCSDLQRHTADVLILAIIEPTQTVHHLQQRLQPRQRPICLGKMVLPGSPATHVGLIQMLKYIQGSPHQPRSDRAAMSPRKACAFGNQPLEKLLASYQYPHWGPVSVHDLTLADVADGSNLLRAAQRAAQGKRGRPDVAAFEAYRADHVLPLHDALQSRTYQPGPYRHFFLHEAKRRKISAAPFIDRVVHHALVQKMEPWFEARFLPTSYASRPGKGTHAAVEALAKAAARYRYVLRADVVRHFPSMDHSILQARLERVLPDEGIRWLIRLLLESGVGALESEADRPWFAGDDLFAATRPRGLPIGNLTSQFWSNVYLDPIDHFMKRTMRVPVYLRYVDDFALFANDKCHLWAAKQALIERLAKLRLRLHVAQAQVAPTAVGTPWLGFVVYPDRRRIKARNVRHFTRRFRAQWDAYQEGRLSFAALDASVCGWLAFIRHAHTWGLKDHVVGPWPPHGQGRCRCD